MEIAERLRNALGRKGAVTIVTLLGAAGMLLIMVSSFLPEGPHKTEPVSVTGTSDTEDYRRAAEKRLEQFLCGIDGAGKVRVCLTVGSGERTVYASEDKVSRSSDHTEEENKYVIVGGNSDRSALVETTEPPEITGAAVICTGGGSPQVQERIYKAVSAILGLPTSRIYVTEMKEEIP